MNKVRDWWFEALCDAYGELYEAYIAEHPEATDEEVFEALEFEHELQARAELRMREALKELKHDNHA